MRSFEEWANQSDYDIDTAKFMFDGGRYFYSVFMCHLSLEKYLKGLFTKVFNEIPPKNHNLIYFLDRLELKLPEELQAFVSALNEAAVTTRYPESLSKVSQDYDKKRSLELLDKSNELLEWLKKQ